MVLNDGGAGGLSTLRVRSADQALFPPEMAQEPEPEIQPEIAHLLDRKNQLITREPTEKSERKRWYEELRTITLRLREFIEQERTIAESNQTRSQREWRANQLLRRRDFAWCLFPEEVLRSYCHHIMHDY